MHLSKPIECITQGVTPNVKERLQLRTMYQYYLSNCNKCTALMEEVRGNRLVGGGKTEYMRALNVFFFF